MEHSTLKELVKRILESPPMDGWSVQGLGMLRLKLSETVRLQIWHPELRVEGVSAIHTHPWSFRSIIVAGVLQDNMYEEVVDGASARSYMKQGIKCGVGSSTVGELQGEPKKVRLGKPRAYFYDEGRFYDHHDVDIHSTSAGSGTVTLLERRHNGSCKAAIYWPEGEEWVSAQPRDVRPHEVRLIIMSALRRF